MDINRLPPRRLGMPSGTTGSTAPSASAPTSSSRASSSGVLSTLLGIGRGSSTRPGGSAARAAIRKGDLDKLGKLLEASPDLALELDSHGDNLLGVAARAGRADAVQLLLQFARSADDRAALLNHRNSKGDTALALGAAGGHVEAVASLLSEPDIDINLANDKGDAPLHHAIANGSAPIVGGLLAKPGGDPNVKNARGDTPLHLAVIHNDAHVTEMLLAHQDSNINLLNSAGQTPLLAALNGGKLEAATLLLKEPLEDDTVTDDEHGNTLLHRMLADTVLRPEWITALASNPELANRPNRLGETPLQIVIRGDHHEALRALLKGGAVDTELEDSQGHLPLENAMKRIFGAMEPHLERRIETLRVLIKSPFVNSNVRFNNGATLLTELCAMGKEERDANNRKRQLHFACQTLTELLKIRSSDLNLNLGNVEGKTPLTLAAENNALKAFHLLLNDARTDPNVLTKGVIRSPARVFVLLRSGRDRHRPPEHEIRAYLHEKLTNWADKIAPNGKHFPHAHITNAELGMQLSATEKADAAQGGHSACAKGAVFHLSLALEQCLENQMYRNVGERARQLLQNAPADLAHFNLQGVDVPRQVVEGWAAGKLPEGGVNRLIDANIANARIADVHGGGLTARGKQIMQAMDGRLPAERLDTAQCIAGVRAAIASATHATPEWRAQATQGLDLALAHEKRVGDGLDTTVREALTSMWNHIQSYAADASRQMAGDEPLRGALTHSLLENMVDMSAGYCDTGCVQRILYAVDGLDLSLFPTEPTQDIVSDEIAHLAGEVNNRFEDLYGHGAEASGAADDMPSSSTAHPLTDGERLLIQRYQGQGEVDGDVVLRVKQDMLEAAVLADLVERRGWRAELVRPKLDRMKKMMEDL